MLGIRVTSSNDHDGKSAVRVYLNNTLIVTEYIAKRNPLPYLRSLTKSKHFRNIEMQLLPYNLTLDDVGITPCKR